MIFLAVIIKSCEKRSLAHKCGIKDQDILVSINGNVIEDVLDYRFYVAENKLDIVILRKGKEKTFTIIKDEYDDIGIEFDSYLMDKQHGCKNKCIFCFIDQLPRGMRKSLYFKDDDSRMSFLFGNYITLTNITRHEIDRIIKMHISPINISVHTANPELRSKMMGNNNAGEALKIIDEFANAGIKMNCQIVLCKGINDGDELKHTLEFLGDRYPNVSSVAVVPVGMTKHRDNLYPLIPHDEASAKDAICIIEHFAYDFYKKHGTRFAFASDEMYIKAKLPIPSEDFYEDYPQIENGVGLIASLKTDFLSALEQCEDDNIKGNVTMVTGVDSYSLLKELTDGFTEKFPGVSINLYPIVNDFFGHDITVTGLITGGDIIKQLKDKETSNNLLIPSCMLKHGETVFLDDVTVEDIEKELSLNITIVECDGYDLVDTLIDICND